MGIEMKIVGDDAGIRTLADWLSPKLKDPVVEMDLEAAYTASNIGTAWTGEASHAFERAIHDVRGVLSPVSSYLGDAGTVFRAYANRLERGREDFAEWKTKAASDGLTVIGDQIAYPTTALTHCPTPDADSADVREYEAYLKRIERYNKISEDVGKWWGNLEQWVSEHFLPLVTRIEDFSNIRSPLDGLSVKNSDVVGGVLEYYDQNLSQQLKGYEEVSSKAQADYEKFNRELRSGNPAVKAAAEAANPAEISKGLKAVNEQISELAHYSKILGRALPVVDVLFASVEIAQGGSPSSVGVEFVGGALAGTLFAGALATIEVPPVSAAIAIAGVAVLGGGAAVWLYEGAVPLDVRETIDEGLKDFGNWIVFWD